MGYIKRKLKSNSGATLLMALLFFAVCAVTGSMILVSATAAAGRLDGLSKRDQNYYAVRSAVKLLEQELKNRYVEVRETLTVIVETETKTDEEGNEYEETTTSYDYSGPSFFTVNVGDENHPVPVDNPSEDAGMMVEFLRGDGISFCQAKEAAAGSSDSIPSMFNKNWFRGPVGGDVVKTETKKYSMTVSSTEVSLNELSVDVEAYMDSTGLLTLTFTNADDPDSDKSTENKYSMILKMQCDKSSEDKKYPTAHSEEGDAETDTTVKTKVYKFRLETVGIVKS